MTWIILAMVGISSDHFEIERILEKDKSTIPAVVSSCELIGSTQQ